MIRAINALIAAAAAFSRERLRQFWAPYSAWCPLPPALPCSSIRCVENPQLLDSSKSPHSKRSPTTVCPENSPSSPQDRMHGTNSLRHPLAQSICADLPIATSKRSMSFVLTQDVLLILFPTGSVI